MSDYFGINKSECPFCRRTINSDVDFKDELSKKEHLISGLCQKCQDKTFKKDGGNEL